MGCWGNPGPLLDARACSASVGNLPFGVQALKIGV